MLMPGRSYNSAEYRYGFNGQEKDDEIKGSGNAMTAQFWEYDTRLGVRWNRDPITFAWQSPYATFNNNPIYYVDPKGLYGDKKEAREARKAAKAGGFDPGRIYKTGKEYGFNVRDKENAVVGTFKRKDFSTPAPSVTPANTPAGNPTPGPANSGPQWARDVIDNWQHQWDGTNWGGERGTGKYTPPGNPDGVVITVGGNVGHGAVGSQGVSLAITGEGAGTYWNTGGGAGSEGINAGISVSFLYKNANAERLYGSNPLPLQDISGTGMQYGGSVGEGISVGGSYSYNTNASDNMLRPATYNSVGVNVGIGVASAPITGSAQITVSQPLLMVDKNGFYLGKGRN